MDIRQILRDLGFATISESHDSRIALWEAWYRGHVSEFHDYSIYNGRRHIGQRRAQLNMAKAGAEFWANLLWNSDCFISLDEPIAQAALNAALEKNEFTRRTNILTEKAFALGTGAYVVESVPHRPPRINYVNAGQIYPLEWAGDECLSCAFSSEMISANGEKLLYLTLHERLREDSYRIRNVFYLLKNGKTTPVKAPEGIASELISPVKRFALIRPNIANNISEPSPMGMSVYANCLDTLETLDLCYDGLKVSLKVGRPRIAAMAPAFTVDNEGSHHTFDTNDTVFYRFPSNDDLSENKLIQDITTEYRAGHFETSLEKCATLYSMQIGLGNKAFNWDSATHVMQTATQVIAESSTMLRAMQKHQEALRPAIIDLCRAILHLSGIHYTGDVNITFDDSVLRDKEAEKTHAWQWVSAGKYPFWAYLVKFWGYTEAEARKLESEAGNHQPSTIKDGGNDEGRFFA